MPLRRTFAVRLHLAALLLAATCGGCDLDIDQPQLDGPKLTGPSAVLIEIDGPIPQFSDPSGMFPAMETSQRALEEVLAKAAKDPAVQEVVIHFGAPQISLARAGELSAAIRRLMEQGKPVTCHLDGADNVTYWLAATACQRILVSPAGGVEALGLSLEALFLRELLASLGVTADMLHIGRYKDAAETLTRDDMSPESREAAEILVRELNRHFIEGIAAGRKLDAGAVQGLIDGGPYDANRAVELKLADYVSTLGAYLDSARQRYAGGVVDNYGKKPPKPFSFGEFMQLLGNPAEADAQNKEAHVALVPVVGPISSGRGDELFGGMEMVYDLDLVETLGELTRDTSARAVVLRIDSPGGSALASDNIWNAVRTLAATKPVVASLGDVAASGGYYIASAASEIYTSPTTLTGSIGVVGGKIVFGEAARKIGVHTERIDTSRRAGLLSPFSPFSEDERGAIKGLMQSAYDLFIERVVTGRGLEKSKVEAVAEGRVWTGSQALTHGLVNTAGGLHDAITRARSLGGLPVTAPVELHPKPKNFMEILGEALSDQETSAVLRMARRHPSVRHALALVELFSGHKVLAVAPAYYEIH